jgi:thiol-disulfide isomerase/thioredoxin
MKKLILLPALFLCSISFAQKSTQPALRVYLGNWRGVLAMNDSTELPFTFKMDLLQTGYTLTIQNAEEQIKVEDLVVTKDSINWHMPVFDSWFKCKIDSLTGFHGVFTNHSASKPYEMKFRADFAHFRFPHMALVNDNEKFNGKWECDFSPGTADSSKAIGNFLAEKLRITGTFLTETGDYRFLEGNYLSAKSFAVSCFDGSHAFLFKAELGKDGKLHGNAWYGKFGYEKWEGRRNDKFELRDPSKLTFIKDSSNVNFTFNDLNGKPVSLSDYRGKVVVVEIMGSWCPNCMDETAWMTEVYNKYHAQGLEVIALAYERSTDTAKANPNIRRVRDHYGAKYTFLNTGKSGKSAASESLPFLNDIMSFPTTIYIDKNGKVRMVYTGFNGPATGTAYVKDTGEAIRLIEQMLSEK